MTLSFNPSIKHHPETLIWLFRQIMFLSITPLLCSLFTNKQLPFSFCDRFHSYVCVCFFFFLVHSVKWNWVLIFVQSGCGKAWAPCGPLLTVMCEKAFSREKETTVFEFLSTIRMCLLATVHHIMGWELTTYYIQPLLGNIRVRTCKL